MLSDYTAKALTALFIMSILALLCHKWKRRLKRRDILRINYKKYLDARTARLAHQRVHTPSCYADHEENQKLLQLEVGALFHYLQHVDQKGIKILNLQKELNRLQDQMD